MVLHSRILKEVDLKYGKTITSDVFDLYCDDVLVCNSDINTYGITSENFRLKSFIPVYTLKSNQPYTITYKILENTANSIRLVSNYEDKTNEEIRLDLNSNITVFTPSKNIVSIRVGLQTNTENPVECKLQDIMIFEGDLTQTPELIPTEYVEGLKSSFEDEMIPVNLAVNTTNKTLVGSGERFYYTQYTMTQGVTYTVCCNLDNVVNTSEFKAVYSNNGSDVTVLLKGCIKPFVL